jgi:uroporphyrinogen-III synthase
MRRVVVVRPEPGATATVERAREHGLHAVAMPLFVVEPVAWAVPNPKSFDALLLTSANAVRHGGPSLAELRGLPVHAVGEATAAAALEAGFSVGTTGTGGIDDLLNEVEPGLRLLHLCGEDHRDPGAAHAITTVIVYRSRALPAPPQLATIGGDVVLIHSPRAGARLSDVTQHAPVDRASIAIAAISPAAAEAAGPGWARVESAQVPSDDALLALAERLCNNPAAR